MIAKIRELEKRLSPKIKKQKAPPTEDLFAIIQDASEYVESIFENVAKVNKIRLETQQKERTLVT